MLNREILVIGPRGQYPAFQSIIRILQEIFNRNRVKILRFEFQLNYVPKALRILFLLLQELIVIFHLLKARWNRSKAVIFIFQRYLPMISVISKLFNYKLVYYIGGSAYKSSYYENISLLGRVLAYSNLLLQRFCLSFCDRILIPSSAMLDWLELNDYTGKIQSVIGIVDSQFFNKFRILNTYSTRENIIGYVGSLKRGKGVQELIESTHFIRSKQKITNFRLLIIGQGPFRAELEKIIQDLQLDTHVNLAGFVQHNDLPLFYNKMKLFVSISYTEGLPSTFLEAMACGTPVLTTRVGAIPLIISDYQNGFLLKSSTPPEIALKIAQLLENQETLENVSANSVQFVKTKFDYNLSLEKWRLLFERLD